MEILYLFSIQLYFSICLLNYKKCDLKYTNMELMVYLILFTLHEYIDKLNLSFYLKNIQYYYR